MNPSASRPHPSPSPSPALPVDSLSSSTTSKSLIKDQISSSRSSINKPQIKRHEDKTSNQDNSNAIKVTSVKRNTPPTDDSKEDDSGSEAETIVLQGSRSQPRHEINAKAGNGVEGPQRNGQKRGMRGSKRSSGHDNAEDLYSSDLSSAPSSPQPRLSTKPTTNGVHRRSLSSIGNGDSARYKAETSEHSNDHTLASRKRKITRVSSKLADSEDGDSPNGSRHKSLSPSTSGRTLHRATAIQDSYRRGHTRTRSAQTLGTPAKTLKSRKSQIHSLYFHGDISDDHSLSSSRSCSPDHTLRHRGRSPSDNVASTARIITSHRSKRDTTGRTTFWKRCEKGLLTEAKKLLELNPGYLTEVDNGGYLPIHAAALNGRDEVTRFLIQAGSPIDQPAQDLSTPLFDAVDNRHINVVKLLLEAGADPRRRNKTGQTVLDAAVEAKKQAIEDSDTTAAEEIEIIENALQAAVVKLRSKRAHDDDSTNGMNAAENNSSRGVSIASPVHMSPPPTSAAVQTTSSRRRTGRSEPTRQDLLWLDSGKGGMQKLKDSSKNGDIEMVGKLLESGNPPDDESVILAAKGGHIDVLSLLLAFGGNGDPDPKESVKRARDKGYSLNPGEETPILAIIGRGGNIEILKLLLKTEGMNARRLDTRGRTYIELAKERAGDNWEEEVRLLQKAWDDAAPRGKKNKEKNNRDASPALSVKSKMNYSARSTSTAADDTKIIKRQHRRSISEAVSSINGDSHISSDKDSTTTKKMKSTRNDDMDRRERERKAVDSDNSTISDVNAAPGTVKKKRRLISGKDLAAKVSNKADSDTKTIPNLKTLSTIVKDEDVELSDGKINSRRGSESGSYRKPVIKKENSDSLKIVSTKRNRESSTSSTTRISQQDKSSDTETSSITKKKRKLESRQEKESVATKVKAKEQETKHAFIPTNDSLKQNKLRAERTDDDALSTSSSGRKRCQDADSEKRRKKRREDDTIPPIKKDKRVNTDKEHNFSDKPTVTPRPTLIEAKPKHMGSKPSDSEKTKHNDMKADATVSNNKNKIYIPSPVDEIARVTVLLREQRSFQEKGLIAGATQREAFKLIKAEKDREREAMERAEREEEAERQEEERRQRELLLEKQRLEEAEMAEQLRQENEAIEREAIRRASEQEVIQRLADEQRARQRREEEMEQARIESLPLIYKLAALGKPMPETDPIQAIRRFLPLYVHDPDNLALKETTSEVEDPNHNLWISNVQAVLLLNSAFDLDVKGFHIDERRPMHSFEQFTLRNLLLDMYYFGDASPEPYDLNEDWKKRDKEMAKFVALKDLFWIRVSEFLRILREHNKCGILTESSCLPLARISVTQPVYNTSNPWK